VGTLHLISPSHSVFYIMFILAYEHDGPGRVLPGELDDYLLPSPSFT
jgi:hypothetical protein